MSLLVAVSDCHSTTFKALKAGSYLQHTMKKYYSDSAFSNCVFLDCCRHLKMFLTQFNAVADRLMKALTHVADGQTVFSMHEYFCYVTMDVIAEVLLRIVLCVLYM